VIWVAPAVRESVIWAQAYWLVAFASLLLRFRGSAPELIGTLLLVLLLEGLAWGLLQR